LDELVLITCLVVARHQPPIVPEPQRPPRAHCCSHSCGGHPRPNRWLR